MIIKTLKYFFYGILILITLLIPLYGAARLVLPKYIEKEIIKNLPAGSTLRIGSIYSEPNLSIVFENIDLKFQKNEFTLFSPKLKLKPRLDILKPIQISSEELTSQNPNSVLTFKDLQADIIINKNDKKRISIFGEINEIESSDVFIFSELEFLLEGINAKNKSVKLNAKYINFIFKNEYGNFKFEWKKFI